MAPKLIQARELTTAWPIVGESDNRGGCGKFRHDIQQLTKSFTPLLQGLIPLLASLIVRMKVSFTLFYTSVQYISCEQIDYSKVT